MAIPNFSIDAYSSMVAPAPGISLGPPYSTGAASYQTLPGGGGPTLRVANYGPNGAFVVLALTPEAAQLVGSANGVLIAAKESLLLAVGANAYIGAIGADGVAFLNLAQGS